MTINVGIIGAGRIARVHADALQTRIPSANVLAVLDVHMYHAEAVAEPYNIPHPTTDPSDILSNPEIDAVVICSSTDTHSRFIIESAQAGKHVFCEKPIDLSLDKIDEALAAVNEAGVKFQVGFNRRFDPNIIRVKQAIDSGEIGTPHLLHIISRDPAPPPIEYIRVSGGIFLDMTIHDFDIARYLIGSEVEEIYTAAANRVDPAIGAEGDVDTAHITLKFANDVIGTVDNSRQAVYGYDQRVEVFGSGGAVHTDNWYEHTVHLSTSESVRHGGLPMHFFLERYMQSYINEMQSFIDAIENDAPVACSGAEGRIPVIMGLAARKSYDENRPVKLSEIG